jgi:hypothetical protein
MVALLILVAVLQLFPISRDDIPENPVQEGPKNRWSQFPHDPPIGRLIGICQTVLWPIFFQIISCWRSFEFTLFSLLLQQRCIGTCFRCPVLKIDVRRIEAFVNRKVTDTGEEVYERRPGEYKPAAHIAFIARPITHPFFFVMESQNHKCAAIDGGLTIIFEQSDEELY